jgi:uncharacterized protein YndB with AHSA1/START domain
MIVILLQIDHNSTKPQFHLSIFTSMETTLTIYEWKEINSNVTSVFNLLGTEKFMSLTGANEITFDFREGGEFKLSFPGRGEIFGTVDEIIPYHRIVLDWNVTGFNMPDETNTKVIILMVTSKGTTVSIEHSEIKNEEAADAKRNAWKGILSNLKKLLEV